MNVEEMEKKWQAALRKIFPGVIVREVTNIPEKDILPFLGVYMIPDDKAVTYMRFSLDERPDFVVREDLPDCDLIPRTESVTREWFPKIWAEAQEEARRATSAQLVKSPSPAKIRSRKKAADPTVPSRKKTAAGKSARRPHPVSK